MISIVWAVLTLDNKNLTYYYQQRRKEEEIKMLRNFRISAELKPYIRRILLRRNIPFKFFTEQDTLYIRVPLSGERFHRIVKRAKCDKHTKEVGVFTVTREEAANETRLQYLLQEYHQDSYQIL